VLELDDERAELYVAGIGADVDAGRRELWINDRQSGPRRHVNAGLTVEDPEVIQQAESH
jgi:hypothetical protein